MNEGAVELATFYDTLEDTFTKRNGRMFGWIAVIILIVVLLIMLMMAVVIIVMQWWNNKNIRELGRYHERQMERLAARMGDQREPIPTPKPTFINIHTPSLTFNHYPQNDYRLMDMGDQREPIPISYQHQPSVNYIYPTLDYTLTPIVEQIR